jgi:multidrug resistance efflux pump
VEGVEGNTPAAAAAANPSPVAAVSPSGDIALESKGYIIPAHQILVSPKVSGMVVTFKIEEGQRVQQHEVLAELESIDYQADYDRTRATLELARQRLLELENGNRPDEIEQAHAELEESQANLVQLESEWSRNQDLRKRNVIAESDLVESESKYRAMLRRIQRLKLGLKLMQDGPRKERVEAARAEMRQAEADAVKSKWRLDNCQIRAPITGTILKKNAEEGNIVNPVAFNGSFSVCDMADLSDLEVDLTIQERDISRVFKGQKCKVRAEAFPDRVYDGVVSRLMPIADRAKGAVPVRVKLSVPADEEGVYLKPEMGAIVSFLNDKPTPEAP